MLLKHMDRYIACHMRNGYVFCSLNEQTTATLNKLLLIREIIIYANKIQLSIEIESYDTVSELH